jgi:hypothetical protein
MYRTVVHQHQHQPARVDAEEEGREILVGEKVDRVGMPLQPLDVQEDAQLLRAGGDGVVEDVQPLPAEHFPGADILFDQLDHDAPPGQAGISSSS